MNHWDSVFKLTSILIASFFSGFVIAINIKADNNKFTMIQFVAKVLMHAVSGIAIGLLATNFISDILLLCGISIVGGLGGENLLKRIVNIAIRKYLPEEPEKKDENESDS